MIAPIFITLALLGCFAIAKSINWMFGPDDDIFKL